MKTGLLYFALTAWAVTAVILALKIDADKVKVALVDSQLQQIRLQKANLDARNTYINMLNNQNVQCQKLLEHYLTSTNPGVYQIQTLSGVFERAGQTNVAAALTILGASVNEHDITNYLRAVGPYAIILRDGIAAKGERVRSGAKIN